MALTSRIGVYDDRWPGMFERDARGLSPIFGTALVMLYHVGSTAVAGLSAKPEIDILAIVRETIKIDGWTLPRIGADTRR